VQVPGPRSFFEHDRNDSIGVRRVMSSRMFGLAVLWTCASGLSQTQAPQLRPAPPPILGSVKVGGTSFETRYYFDHNALQRVVRTGGSIIALTASGNLLRYDKATLAVTGESVLVGRATALAADDERHVLVGTEDGQIDRIEIDTWRRSPVATGEGRIVWIGKSGGSVIAAAVAARGRKWWPGESVRNYSKRSDAEESSAKTRDAVLVVEGGRTRRLGVRGSKVYLPEAVYGLDDGTLWIGNDGGEFGGSLHRIDLRTGTITPVTFSHNVRGFTIVSEAVYAYGGVSHMGMETGYVSRIGSGPPEDVAQFNNDAGVKNERPVDPARPSGPIDHLVPTAEGEGFWAVSNHQVFRVDKALRSWSRTESLSGRWFGGARYAVANTPTVNGLIVDGDRLIAAMGRDGLASVSRSGESRTAFAGQLEIDGLDIWTTSAGTILLPGGLGQSAWRLGTQGWDGTFFDRINSAKPEGWYECAVAGDDGKGVVVFCEGPITPGDRALFRVGPDGRAEVLDRWTGQGDAIWGWLLSPTNQAVETAYGGELRVRSNGGWLTIGRNALPEDWDILGRGSQRRFSLLDRIGEVRYFHDSDKGYLAALAPKAGGSLELARVRGIGDRSIGIWDAVPDGDNWILSASHTGLYRVHLPDGKAQRFASPKDGDVITTIARDRQGRLWAGGDAIYISNDEGAHWTMLDLPMTSRDSTRRIRPNPNADRGVWISLGDRGFVIVQ
jgi:hypothetical protein